MADEKTNRDQEKHGGSSGGRNPNRSSKPNTGGSPRTGGSSGGSKSGGGSQSPKDGDSDRHQEKGE